MTRNCTRDSLCEDSTLGTGSQWCGCLETMVDGIKFGEETKRACTWTSSVLGLLCYAWSPFELGRRSRDWLSVLSAWAGPKIPFIRKQRKGKLVSELGVWAVVAGVVAPFDLAFSRLQSSRCWSVGQGCIEMERALRAYGEVLRLIRLLPKQTRSYYQQYARENFVNYREVSGSDSMEELLQRTYHQSCWVLKKYQVDEAAAKNLKETCLNT